MTWHDELFSRPGIIRWQWVFWSGVSDIISGNKQGIWKTVILSIILFTSRYYTFSVAKATLELQMFVCQSVHQSQKPICRSESCLSALTCICHLSAIMHISYQPSYLSAPPLSASCLGHHAFTSHHTHQPLCQSAIMNYHLPIIHRR